MQLCMTLSSIPYVQNDDSMACVGVYQAKKLYVQNGGIPSQKGLFEQKI